MSDERWYVLYREPGGRLVSITTVLADPLPAGIVVREYAERPDQDGLVWLDDLRDFVPNPNFHVADA